jgi:hypothetical protein
MLKSLIEVFKEKLASRPTKINLVRTYPPKAQAQPAQHTPSILEELNLVDDLWYEHVNADSYCAAIDAWIEGEIPYEHIGLYAKEICVRRKFEPPTR